MKARLTARVALFTLVYGSATAMYLRPPLACADVVKAKEEAEGRGYAFVTNRSEILANARKEAKLRVLAELQAPTIKASTRAFMEKYPFIDLHVEEVRGADVGQRVLLEINAGVSRDWD